MRSRTEDGNGDPDVSFDFEFRESWRVWMYILRVWKQRFRGVDIVAPYISIIEAILHLCLL